MLDQNVGVFLRGFGIESADALKGSRRPRKQTEMAEIGDIQQSLVQHFGDIKDPRVERTKKHQLTGNPKTLGDRKRGSLDS